MQIILQHDKNQYPFQQKHLKNFCNLKVKKSKICHFDEFDSSGVKNMSGIRYIRCTISLLIMFFNFQ